MYSLVLTSIALLSQLDSLTGSNDLAQKNQNLRKENFQCVQQRDNMNDGVKKSILGAMNARRRSIADPLSAGKFPVAFPISDLTWDLELAQEAKQTAFTCPLVALVSFNLTMIGSEQIGQSIAIKIWEQEPRRDFNVEELLVRYSAAATRMSGNIISAAVKLHTRIGTIDGLLASKTIAIVKKYESGDWDAGYQILWESTKKVGCSYVTYKNGETNTIGNLYNDSMLDTNYISTNLSFHALVCNFSPAGCINGQQVYKVKIEPTTTSTNPPTTQGAHNFAAVHLIRCRSIFAVVLAQSILRDYKYQ